MYPLGKWMASAECFSSIFFLSLYRMCTQQALRITSCIHEADTKGNRKTKGVKVLGQRIDHAGRLLLNHGYMSDAIKTENSAYLNDEIVKKVISQMWYQHESLSFRRVSNYEASIGYMYNKIV
jgi:hypothetical protein